MGLKIGLKHTSRATVCEANTAAAMGSGDLAVFATPAMIALMENAAAQAVSEVMQSGETTVGTVVNIVHARATPLGGVVSATAELREIEGRRLVFHVSASDSKGVIGEGVHERYVVDSERFMAKLGN